MKHGLAIFASVTCLLGCGSEVTRDASGGHDGAASSADGSGSTGDGSGGLDPGCSTGGSGILQPGAYFLIADLAKPVPTQLQLLAWLDVAASGTVTGRFTNADRYPGPTCGCADLDACSSVDPARCVLPSAKAGSEDEYADFLVPNPDPPEGYTFTTSGCAIDQADGSVVFAPAPVDIEIDQPPVTVVAARLTVQCATDGAGVPRCRGTFDSDGVLLGTVESGPAQGTLVGRTIPEGEVPGDVPKP